MINRSFVRLLDTQSNGAAVAAALTSLARNLGIETTAEGVETQGFLYSQPVIVEEVKAHEQELQVSRSTHEFWSIAQGRPRAHLIEIRAEAAALELCTTNSVLISNSGEQDGEP